MQEAHAAGCHSTADADRYLEQKRKKETEENGSRKESCQDGGIRSRDNILNSSISSADPTNTYSSQRIACQSNPGSFADSDPMDCPAAEFLSAPVSIISSSVWKTSFLVVWSFLCINIFFSD